MELQGDRFILRSWRHDDAGALAKYANNRKVWRNLGDRFPHPYTLELAEQWLETVRTGDLDEETAAIEIAGEAVGGIGVRSAADPAYAKTAGLGYWIGEPFWGQGLMTEVVGLLTAHLFETRGIARVEAWVFGWNPASGRVLEKNGFVLEGRLRNRVFKDGQFTDEVHYGKLRSARAPGEDRP